jgi:anti-sigma regulatory factor (Ser/Thr protein kinase)
MAKGLDAPGGMHSPAGAGESWEVRQLILPAAAQAPGLARLATREVVTSWRMAHLEETAALLVSELVTNSVRHARTQLLLRLQATGIALRIEVHDGRAERPQPRSPDTLAESGFGLVLVDALASKWGVDETSTGKAVWAELEAGR